MRGAGLFDAGVRFSHRGVGWYRRFVEYRVVCMRLRGDLALRVFWDGRRLVNATCRIPVRVRI